MNRSHIATSFYGSPWALEQRKLREIERVIRSRTTVQRGFVPKRPKPQAWDDGRRRETAAPRPDQFTTVGNVAVIPVMGIIAQRMNMMLDFSGGTSTDILGMKIDAAVADSAVGAIVLDVDSPGGSVFGTPELAAKILDARKSKRVVAVANSMMASAAYWIGSAASEVVMTPAGIVGSIGVYQLHEDISGELEQNGIRATLISSGKYKVEGNPYEPLSGEARASMQAETDVFYTMFVNAVAKHRGTTPDAVRSGYGEGRALTADAALGAKLVDRVATFEQVLREEVGRAQQSANFGFAKARQAQLEAELDIAG